MSPIRDSIQNNIVISQSNLKDLTKDDENNQSVSPGKHMLLGVTSEQTLDNIEYEFNEEEAILQA